MSGEAALAALLDPTSKVVNRLTIPEGWTARQIFAAWSKKTGIARADFEAASKDRKAIGLPAYAKGVEGYLYPATYDVPAKPTATDIVKMMVDAVLQEAKKIGVTERAGPSRPEGSGGVRDVGEHRAEGGEPRRGHAEGGRGWCSTGWPSRQEAAVRLDAEVPLPG